MRGLPIEDRFWEKVDIGDWLDCWEWTAAVSPSGYGRFFMDGKARRSHRVAYGLLVGPVPPDLFVCHQCDNPRCCNPCHLFLGTNADNMADMARKGRATRTDACRGEANHCTVLTAEQVLEIRALAASGASTRELAATYGVGQSTVYHAIKGHSWKHLPGAA